MKKGRWAAVWHAVLPQDLWAGHDVAGTKEWIAARRSEQRLVGKCLVPGMLAGACVAIVGHAGLADVAVGMVIGMGLGLLAGLVVVAWRRRGWAS